MDAQGVNVYISKSSQEMLDNLTDQFKDEMNYYLCLSSKNCTNDSYAFQQDTQEVYVGPVTKGDINITSTLYGLTVKVNLTMWAHSGTKYRFRNEHVPITVEVPVRLVQMQEKAQNFTKSYATAVNAATTIALYIRATLSSHDPKGNGSFLREGDLSYDPLDAVVRMDLEQLRTDGVHFESVGSVPAATYLSEAYFLGEPSFLPPGVDFNSPSFNPENLTKMLRGAFDLKGAMNCSSLSDDKRTECEEMVDESKLRHKAEELSIQTDKLEKIKNDTEKWINKYEDIDKTSLENMTCGEFTDETEKVINEIVNEFLVDNPQYYIISPSEGYSKDSSIEETIHGNEEVIKNVGLAVEALNEIRDIRLSLISTNPCHQEEDKDCERPHSEDDNCDDPIFNGPLNCSSRGEDYFCGKQEVGERPCERVNCTRECDSGDEECKKDRDYTRRVCGIKTCNCMCHPSQNVTNDILSQFRVVDDAIGDKIGRLREQEKELSDRADVVHASDIKLSQVESLGSSLVSGYDVVSSTSFYKVKYYSPSELTVFGQQIIIPDIISPGTKCYYNPSWQVRKNGTCANAPESTGMYTVQVSAAVICCGIFSPCCETVYYARRFFPVIYQVTGEYNISEKIIDDRDRMMLHNIYAGEDDLYGLNLTHQLFTHVAPEFVIYKNYHVSVSSMTGERVLVYVDMEGVADNSVRSSVKKIMDSFTDPTCGGVGC
jgi:hypothetical protein